MYPKLKLSEQGSVKQSEDLGVQARTEVERQGLPTRLTKGCVRAEATGVPPKRRW